MNVSDVEVELQRALKQQEGTSEALHAAVGDKLQAEAELKKAMVGCRIMLLSALDDVAAL